MDGPFTWLFGGREKDAWRSNTQYPETEFLFKLQVIRKVLINSATCIIIHMPRFFVDLNTRNGSASIGSILLKDIDTRDESDRIVSGIDIYPYYLIVSSANVYSVLELKYMYTQCRPNAL